MLRLKNYSFSGIGRFAQKQTIDLEHRDNLIQVNGENTNTGGSSGAGKSTSIEALAYLLGISEIPATQLQSRITKDKIFVEGNFEGDIKITRSAKNGLTIELPGETISGNSKLAEEKLDEIIGVKRSLLKAMCYKRQKQGGFFLNLTPKNSYEFLVECLGLNTLKTKTEKLSIKLKDKYKPNKIDLESGIEELTHTVTQFTQHLENKEKPIKPVLKDVESSKAEIQVLKEKLSGFEKTRNEMLEKLGSEPVKGKVEFQEDQKLKDCESSIVAVKSVIQDNVKKKQGKISQATEALNTIRNNINNANSYKDKMVNTKSTIDKLESELEHLTAGNCPTCMREWKDESLEQKKTAINTSIQENKDIFSKCRGELEKIPNLKVLEEKALSLLEKEENQVINQEEQKTLESLEENKRALLNKKENIESSVQQEYLESYRVWKDKKDFIDGEYSKNTQEINTKIVELKNEIEKVDLQKKTYEESLALYERDYKSTKDKIGEFESKLKEKQKELEKLNRDILLSEESIRLIKNYTLQKFQDTLDYIGARATEIINNIPNMSNAIIYFESAKETGKGNIKNEVNAVINLEGDSAIPIKTLSGGERTSADFAVDIAVSEMIESITNKGVNFLIIDEGLDGLDSISKIECLEILKSLNTDKKMIMIDHSNEVKEMVSDTILVRRINEESFII